MARKPGSYSIGWMPFRVNTFNSMDFRAIQLEYGFEALGVYVKLLCDITSSPSGYFLDFGDDNMNVFALTNSLKFDTLKGILEAFLDRGLFDREIFLAYRVLTNLFVQENFANYCKKRQRPKVRAEIWILSECETVELFSEKQSDSMGATCQGAKVEGIKVRNNDISASDNAITSDINAPEKKRKDKKRKDKKINKGTIKFKIPSVAEVENEFKKKGLGDSSNLMANKFVSFYESKGWKVGKTPMKSWKAAVNTWVLNKKTVGFNGKGVSYQRLDCGDYLGEVPQYFANLNDADCPIEWRNFTKSWEYLSMVLKQTDPDHVGDDGLPIRLSTFMKSVNDESRKKCFPEQWESEIKAKVDGPTYRKILGNIESLIDNYDGFKDAVRGGLKEIKSGKSLDDENEEYQE